MEEPPPVNGYLSLLEDSCALWKPQFCAVRLGRSPRPRWGWVLPAQSTPPRVNAVWV